MRRSIRSSTRRCSVTGLVGVIWPILICGRSGPTWTGGIAWRTRSTHRCPTSPTPPCAAGATGNASSTPSASLSGLNGLAVEVAGEQGGAGDGGGHDQDRAERDEEADEHRDTEAEREPAVLAQDLAAFAQVHSAPGERDPGQLDGERPPADRATDPRRGHRPHGGDQPEEEHQDPDPGGERDQPDRLADAADQLLPPWKVDRVTGIPVMLLDPLGDLLVERVADGQCERGVADDRQED